MFLYAGFYCGACSFCTGVDAGGSHIIWSIILIFSWIIRHNLQRNLWQVGSESVISGHTLPCKNHHPGACGR